jgi:hypothetical protein
MKHRRGGSWMTTMSWSKVGGITRLLTTPSAIVRNRQSLIVGLEWMDERESRPSVRPVHSRPAEKRHYQSQSEVVREGLRLLKEREDFKRLRLSELLSENAKGRGR